MKNQHIDFTKCLGCTWNDKQCKNSKCNKFEFCKQHLNHLPRGRVDNVLDENTAKDIYKKVLNFEKSEKPQWYSRLKLWDCARSKNYNSIDELSYEECLIALLDINEYFIKKSKRNCKLEITSKGRTHFTRGTTLG